MPAFTMRFIETAGCPSERSQVYLWDPTLPRFGVRVRASGAKSWIIMYRAGSGRSAPKRRITLGDVASMSLADARKLARVKLGEVAAGADPVAVRRENERGERTKLTSALDAYERSLEARSLVNTRHIMSLLRRELLDVLGNVDVSELDRAALVGRIREVESGVRHPSKTPRKGAAADLRSKSAVFLNWCVNEGLLPASPLAGWKRERLSREQRLSRPGRSLTDQELPAFWAATEAPGDEAFAVLLKTLLLTGQRRGEVAGMRWQEVDLERRVWVLPEGRTKAGREQLVPLPPELVTILAPLPRCSGCELVFPGRRFRPISGWTQRLAPVREAAGLAHWTLHDLRRTMRSGLSALRVDPVTAELLLNHVQRDELSKIYDRHAYWDQRVEAAGRWARHVTGIVERGPENVVPLRGMA